MFSPRRFIKFNVFTRVGATPRRHFIPVNFRDKDSRPATRPARASVSRKVPLLLCFLEHLQKAEDRFKRMEFPCDRGGSVTQVRCTQLASDATANVCANTKHYVGNDFAGSATTVSSYGISLRIDMYEKHIVYAIYTYCTFLLNIFENILSIRYEFELLQNW